MVCRRHSLRGHVTLTRVKLDLTRRAAYAIRTVLALAHEDGVEVVSARTIAEREHIPVRFLPHVLGDLSRAGIVEAHLGRAGGYRLTKDPRLTSVLEVIEAVEGDARRQTCVLTGGPCGEPGALCDVHAVFAEAQLAILNRLAEATVADILATSAPDDARDRAETQEHHEPMP
jgi:Rrf2 family iron-sulfur cluster assembly transcriptional regulator